MSEKFVSLRNIKFLLYETHDVESLVRYGRFEAHDRETFDMVLDTAYRLAREVLRPKLREMDKEPPIYVNGRVKVNPVVREFMVECGGGGWISASASFDLGGQQLPRSLIGACVFMWAAANYSASVYPMLTAGAAHLIESFGSSQIRDQYIPNMFAGKWQGTMALTEPQAGSSLADITTTAEPTNHGYFKIRGQKIFISAGDHDGVDNVVHLMLAKIKGAPDGVKGISLFVVPRMRPDGECLAFNDVNTAGVFHKLGYRGCPITHLSFGENDDCRAWLLGEPHKGLSYMFQMMNNARIEVGIGATAISSAAYYASLCYARERAQGRRVTDKDPSLPQVPIIEHADVKRMLFFQRAIVEGALSLLLQCGLYSDIVEATEGNDQTKYSLLLDLLTPVAKSYPSELGIMSVSQGLQILGGYGYCDEFPLEQFYRDIRIHPIHEGATGIQGIDLLGRKVVIKEGAAFTLFVHEVAETILAASGFDGLTAYCERLGNAVQALSRVTEHLVSIGKQEHRERFLADATLYLELFGIVAIAWQWLKQGVAALKALSEDVSTEDVAFYQGKYATMQFFFHYELPKVEGLSRRLLEADGFTAQATEAMFSD